MLASGAAGAQTPASAPSSGAPAPEARALLDEAIAIMREHSVRRDKVDWPRLRERAHAKLAGAKAVADALPAIEVALAELGDNHSFLQPVAPPPPPAASAPAASSAEPAAPAQSVPPAIDMPTGRMLAGQVAYLHLPGFMSGPAAAQQYADTLVELIDAYSAAEPLGWVIDLRGNWGGNMWPMLAGVGALAGEGVLGYFVYPEGRRDDWGYERGGSWLVDFRSGRRMTANTAAVPQAAAALRAAPVALLYDRHCGSSCESVAIAFLGRPNLRTFGSATAGLTTSNAGFRLSDGTNMVLTIAIMADRTGRAYGETLTPDEPVEQAEQKASRSATTDADDAVLQAAVRWLRGRG